MKNFFTDLFMSLCTGFTLMIFVLFLYGIEKITKQNLKFARQDKIIAKQNKEIEKQYKIISDADKRMEAARQLFLEKYTVHATMKDVLKGTRKMIYIKSIFDKENKNGLEYKPEVGN